MRRWLAALTLLILLLASLIGGALYTKQRGLQALHARGIDWEGRTRDGLALRFTGVTWRGARADAVQLSLRDPERITASGVDVDLSTIGGALGPGHSGSAIVADLGGALDDERLQGVVIHLEGLTLRWGERILAEGLLGDLSPGRLSLDGDGLSLRVPGSRGERVWIGMERYLDRPDISGHLSIDLSLEASWSLRVRAPSLRLNHPLLASRAFDVSDGSLSLTGSPQEMSGALVLGDVTAALTIACDALPPSSCALTAELPDTPAGIVLQPLAPVLPELRRATVRGTLGGTFTYSWPDGAWTAAPRMIDLGVEGASPVVDDLRGGRFTYLVRDGDGQRTRTTGEGTRSWTPLMGTAPVLGQAIQAAEDATFRSHHGYDPAAIALALSEAAEAGELGRGGSTLTQQLVKNLFLDGGERTLARKLRELLIAVELDRVLGKRRVLELYMNVVEWGPDIHGVAAAADYYFLKRPANLNPAEAAFLAVLLPSPRTYHDLWYMRGRASEVRVGWVLNNMADAGYLSPAEAARWAGETIRFVPPPKSAQK